MHLLTQEAKKTGKKKWDTDLKRSQIKVTYIFFQLINGRVRIMLRSKSYFSFHSDLTVCLGMISFPLISLESPSYAQEK